MDDNNVDLSKRLTDCVEVSGFRVSRPHPLPRNASTLRSTTASATTPRPPLISIATLFYSSSSRKKRLDFRQSPANVPDVPLRVCDMLNLARPSYVPHRGPLRADAGRNLLYQRPPGSAWQRVIQNAIQLPDEHACTITRSLLDFASAKRFDETVYVRVVMLTFDWLGWGVGEGGEVVALWGSVQLVNVVIEYLDNLIHVKHWHLAVSLVEQ
ncbi:hypothetical protein H4582DRAFT_2076046 [Lactarius indigo]|nr:hypothetical protein H4582DRAFT_2076046 [Lactarius indigo]